jgi:hypothetical protein
VLGVYSGLSGIVTMVYFLTLYVVSTNKRMSTFSTLRKTCSLLCVGSAYAFLAAVINMIYFIYLLSTVARRFMSVLVCSACLDKMFSKLVKDSCIILIGPCTPFGFVRYSSIS